MRLRKLISGIAALTVASSAFAGLAITVNAATTTVTPVMTYVDYDNAYTAYGLIAAGNTAKTGYNKISNGSVAFANTGWGCNWITLMRVDASSVTERINKATLTFDGSGSTNSKRTCGYGILYNDIDFNETVTYNSAKSAGLIKGTAVGEMAWTTSTSSTIYNSLSIDVTDAIKNDADKKVTLVIYETAAAGGFIKNPSVEIEASNVDIYKVTYDVRGTVSEEDVESGSKVQSVPETSITGYDFKGWIKDGDTTKLFSTDEIKALTITEATTFTAEYVADSTYIEPLSSVEFTTLPAGGVLTAGADADTAASNIIAVKAVGELGTNIIENPDSRVTDFDVSYELKGFRWVASKGEASTDPDGSATYCDGYGTLVVNQDYSADFQLKSHPFNYYGEIIATVTYNGVTKSVSHPLTFIGNATKTSANDILPRGGYVADYKNYSPDMVGYKAAISADNKSASDIVTDNWAAYGGNNGRGVYIAEDESGRFLKLKSTGTNSSSFAANKITSVTDTQVIFDQMVRFYNANSTILLKSANPVTWSTAEKPVGDVSVTLAFNGTGFVLNGGEKFADATKNTWYRVVISSDVTSKKCFAKIYNADNKIIGTSDTVDFSNPDSVTPTYYCFRTPDKATGELDFNNVHIYRATIDQALMSLTTTSETLVIPEEGEAATTAELTISAKTTEGYDAIGTATWSVEDDVEGITVTTSAEDSHNATVSVDSAATAGTVTINVTIGGTTKSIDLTTTASKDSIKFDTPVVSSISIPMDDTVSTVTYTANVIDKDGNNIAGKDVTFALYDSNNANPVTLTGITLENGVLTVTKDASPAVITIRANSTNSKGESITNVVKVTIHGLAFDLGAGTDEDVVAGYTPVTPSTSYTEKLGYGIIGTATAGGTASLENADSDYLSGTFTFKANVTPNKLYKVTLSYQGDAAFENISSDLTGVVRTNESLSTVEYQTFVQDGILDITFDDKVASIIIEKIDDKTPGSKPNIYTVGDSTIANNGSWAYVLARDIAKYPELENLVTFSNNGRGGKNLMNYYSGGELWDRVVTNIRPGDYVMIGDMGTNGMGATFKDDFNYYIDACLAMGAKVILNSYSPHMCVGNYASCYNEATHTFTAYRTDSGDPTVREIYEERKDELAGWVEIGKNADASFTAYVADYAANKYDSADAAAKAIIDCAGLPGTDPDHNHYSNGTIACQLMLEGYGGTKGIVDQLVDILSAASVPKPVVAEKVGNGHSEVVGDQTIVYTPYKAVVGHTITKIMLDINGVERDVKNYAKDIPTITGGNADVGIIIKSPDKMKLGNLTFKFE